MTRSEVLAASYELENTLTAHDFSDNVVTVHHQDHSKFIMFNAFIKWYDEGVWMVVHTEHNDFLIFNMGDVESYSEDTSIVVLNLGKD
tara:strand:- start:579 stop:842 length:264 start_codon:yes stop_codon:yes gene_type:complete